MAGPILKMSLSGQRELEAALKDLGGKVAGRLGTNAVRAGARVIVNAAKVKAPVRTGELRDSIRMFDERSFTGGTERTAYAGSRLFYAYWVEYGTAHSPARSFLRAAVDEQQTAIADKMAENLGRGLERETAKYRGR